MWRLVYISLKCRWLFQKFVGLVIHLIILGMESLVGLCIALTLRFFHCAIIPAVYFYYSPESPLWIASPVLVDHFQAEWSPQFPLGRLHPGFPYSLPPSFSPGTFIVFFRFCSRWPLLLPFCTGNDLVSGLCKFRGSSFKCCSYSSELLFVRGHGRKHRYNARSSALLRTGFWSPDSVCCQTLISVLPEVLQLMRHFKTDNVCLWQNGGVEGYPLLKTTYTYYVVLGSKPENGHWKNVFLNPKFCRLQTDKAGNSSLITLRRYW